MLQKLIECISYARFSSLEQADGRSMARQRGLVDKYMQSHPECTLASQIADEGLSGYHAKHLSDGGLGILLEKVRNGEIKRGTRLLIEQPDRLGRMGGFKSARLVDELLDAGLEIVTLDDNRHYTQENMSSDGMNSMYLQMRFIRAHEESKNKSFRISESWEAKRKDIAEGKLPKMRTPWWITYPERQSELRNIFRLALEGNGSHKIAKVLNEAGIRAPNNKVGSIWYTANVSNLLRDRKVTGIYENPKTGELHKVFPEVIPLSKFNKVQDLLALRYRTKGNEKKWSNALSGVISCGCCGATIKPTKSKTGRTMYCRSSWIGACENKGGFSYRSALLGVVVVARQDMAAAFAGSTESDDKANREAQLRLELEDAEKSIERLLEAIENIGYSQSLKERYVAAEERKVRASNELTLLDEEQEQDMFGKFTEYMSERGVDEMSDHLLRDVPIPDFNNLLKKIGLTVTLQDKHIYISNEKGERWTVRYASWKETQVLKFIDGEWKLQGTIVKDAVDGTMELMEEVWYLHNPSES